MGPGIGSCPALGDPVDYSRIQAREWHMSGTFLYQVGAGLLVLLAACSKNSSIQEDRRENTICRASADTNGLRVIGGIEDNHIFPTSVLLSIVKGATVETCTGAFISDSLLWDGAAVIHSSSVADTANSGRSGLHCRLWCQESQWRRRRG